jgi:hypothetical protein
MSSLHNLKKISLMISSGFFSPSGSDFCHWFDKKEFKSFYKLVCKEWNVHVVPKNEILGAMVFFYGADKTRQYARLALPLFVEEIASASHFNLDKFLSDLTSFFKNVKTEKDFDSFRTSLFVKYSREKASTYLRLIMKIFQDFPPS